MSFYLGFDSSTQGLKAIIVDVEKGEIVFDENVNFSNDLPEYKCPNGVLENPDPLTKHSDPLMWLAALDLVLERMTKRGAPLSELRGVTGSGQQHGTVYLNSRFSDAIANLTPDKTLVDQITPCLSRKSSPIWMDGATSIECAEITEIIGDRIQQDTGSPAVERFAAAQIRKFRKDDPESYAATTNIHLVSSFMASVLAGRNMPIDFGDGAGMNLLNLNTMNWDADIAAAAAPGLLDRLPNPVASDTLEGTLHSYFSDKYGLPASIPVLVWTGDNPSSLIGTGASAPGTAVVSLGTSDTFFASMESYTVDPDGYGHIFGNPAGGFMSLICFINGSLARESIKDECGVDWDYFGTTAFDETPPGNNGNLMLPYFVPESTPLVLKAGVKRVGGDVFCAGDAVPAVKIRAIVESQALSMKLHSSWIGEFSTLRLTGGASKSPGLCQVFADVFQAKIEKIAVPDSAGLGAVLRAANACAGYSWDDLYAKFAAPVETIEPNPSTSGFYHEALERYRQLEKLR